MLHWKLCHISKSTILVRLIVTFEVISHSNCVTIVIRCSGAGFMIHIILYSVDPFVVLYFVFVVYYFFIFLSFNAFHIVWFIILKCFFIKFFWSDSRKYNPWQWLNLINVICYIIARFGNFGLRIKLQVYRHT